MWISTNEGLQRVDLNKRGSASVWISANEGRPACGSDPTGCGRPAAARRRCRSPGEPSAPRQLPGVAAQVEVERKVSKQFNMFAPCPRRPPAGLRTRRRYQRAARWRRRAALAALQRPAAAAQQGCAIENKHSHSSTSNLRLLLVRLLHLLLLLLTSSSSSSYEVAQRTPRERLGARRKCVLQTNLQSSIHVAF